MIPVATLAENRHLIYNKMDGATADLFVYSMGNKQYAAVIGILPNSLRIADVNEPRKLSSGAKDSIRDAGDMNLKGPSGIAHCQGGGRHYAVVAGGDGIRIMYIADPDNIAAACHMSDTGGRDGRFVLNGANDVAIYTPQAAAPTRWRPDSAG